MVIFQLFKMNINSRTPPREREVRTFIQIMFPTEREVDGGRTEAAALHFKRSPSHPTDSDQNTHTLLTACIFMGGLIFQLFMMNIYLHSFPRERKVRIFIQTIQIQIFITIHYIQIHKVQI